MDREMIWKWMWVANVQENVASVIDNALWDLAGNYAKLPVYKLMGGARDKVKAYASTYPNIGKPHVYAEHALQCKNEGYIAYKIHPHYFWNPETGTPTPGRPSNIKADIETCHLVREAVGPDYVLMFDPWGTYMSPRGGDPGRPRAREAQLLLVRAPDAGIPGRVLCAAEPGTLDPDPVAPRSSPAACSRAPSGSCAAPAT